MMDKNNFNKSTSEKKISSITEGVNKIYYYFGYFYTIINGFEKILIYQDKNKNEWDFLFSGFINDGSIEVSIGDELSNFISQKDLMKNLFIHSDYSKPEIIIIHEALNDSKEFPKRQRIPVLVKVCLGKDIDLKDDSYKWHYKFTLFEKTRNDEIKCKNEEAFHRIEQLRIEKEINLNVLQCVDILVFRENVSCQEGVEFLMIERNKPSETFGGWEYPKGGIKYHETIYEGAIRELKEETNIDDLSLFQYVGDIGFQTSDVTWRNVNRYDLIRVHGLTFMFHGDDNDIKLDPSRKGQHRFTWMTINDARDEIWIGEYGKEFFNRWYKKRWELLNNAARPISLAYQVTEKYPNSCIFCLRRDSSEKPLTIDDIEQLIDILSFRKIRRITFTGGEPLTIGKNNLFRAIKYANTKGIHTCLSTTCIGLQPDDLEVLNTFLDHLLLPVHCISIDTAKFLYRRIDNWRQMHENIRRIIDFACTSNIVIEVSTMVCNHNYNEVLEIGKWLFNKNSKIHWKVEEFYANGNAIEVEKEFQLPEFAFDNMEIEIKEKFAANLKNISFSSKESRLTAPDVMITPQANVVNSDHKRYNLVGGKKTLLLLDFENRRRWSNYRNVCRKDWDWYNNCLQ